MLEADNFLPYTLFNSDNAGRHDLYILHRSTYIQPHHNHRVTGSTTALDKLFDTSTGTISVLKTILKLDISTLVGTNVHRGAHHPLVALNIGRAKPTGR